MMIGRSGSVALAAMPGISSWRTVTIYYKSDGNVKIAQLQLGFQSRCRPLGHKLHQQWSVNVTGN